MEASQVKAEVFCNEPFYWTKNSKERIIIHQGGTGSGKTYSILQYLIFLATSEKNLTIDIGRRRLTSLKSSAYGDFLTILTALPIEFEENRSELVYTFQTGQNLYESIEKPEMYLRW